ncbi:zinc ribbon domain-containing protein [Olsenella sp. Marseille-QA0557]|uniref:Zinc ribbon domain-containing protein n=1 Tax=Candidatus Coprovicinus avistercoris TaxID=2840754 RepID=A0A9D1HXA9_9ACTN|nr:zinc ribbon domain-containing protein [Candidatus Coprovicinus avistercoris]
MICPYCGTNVSDDASVCPACHGELGATTVLPKIEGNYCSACGSLLPEGAATCPVCGMPVVNEEASSTNTSKDSGRQLHIPEVDVADEEDEQALEETHSMPRIESAIPAESEPDYGRLPHTKTVLVCALASLVLIGGLALILTHPWNPQAYSSRATEARDTSTAGFPGVVERLSGQDSSDQEDQEETLTGDEATYQQLSEDYKELADLAERIDKAEDGFEEAAFGGDQEAFDNASSECEELSYDVSNLISDIQSVDVTSGTYAEDVEHLVTLGNWLRNRVDALNSAWNSAEASSDPAANRDEIMAPLVGSQNASGENTYKGLFNQNYEAWEPQAPDESN